MDMLPLPVDALPELEIRELTLDERDLIKPVFQVQNTEMPDPRYSTILGVIRKGKIVGFGVLQLKLHAEPVYLEDGESGQFIPLVSAMEKTALQKCGPCWVYLFAPAGRVTKLAQTMGLQLEPWCVLSKLVTPEAPPRSDPFTEKLEDMPVEGATQ
jgi:hypothetical protein